MKKNTSKLTKSLEDYIEAMYIFEEKNGFSRIKDIAVFLKVKFPSVNKAVKELEKENLIIHQKYGYIKLTENGKKIAQSIVKTHKDLVEFFELLGFSHKSSLKYGCSLEHIIDEVDKKIVSKLIYKIKYLKRKNIWQ
ncbi:MAG: metal-dependent transcriptional regulator [Elusimicrobiales bacterium]|nr:metal-dependent transcriptional regulator [Elusimicrobiales bacterium]